MKKIIARYFYAPICAESFATLKRLKKLFNNLEEHIHFEFFNTVEKNLISAYPWYSDEKEILNTVEGNGTKPLIYSKLFIEGKEIKGFPPSKKMIEKVLQEYNIQFSQDAYMTDYKKTDREPWNIVKEKISLRKYDVTSIKDSCLVCTKHNPLLEELEYKQEKWSVHEDLKGSYLEDQLEEKKMIGLIAYYEDQPVGFIEAFSLKLASKLGFPVSHMNENGVMITCLNIRTEVAGNGIASKLINEIIVEARNKNYWSIEVLAFPDQNNWHPISLYQKHGFKPALVINDLEELLLMKMELKAK